VVTRGDMKSRRRGNLNAKAAMVLRRDNLTLEQMQAMERDGGTRY
jgi:hypothetical protein